MLGDQTAVRPRIKRILKDLESSDEDIATYAAMNVLRLKEINEAEIVELMPILRRATSSPSISVRFFARKALNEVRISGRKYPKLHHETDMLRERGRQISWQGLLRTVLKLGIEQKLVILDLLRDVDDPQVVSALLAYLRIEQDPFVTAEIIRILGMLGDSDLLPTLKEFLTHPDSRIRSNAVEALEEIGGKEVVEALVPLLRDDDNRVKATVARIVARYGGPNVLTTLAGMLRSVEIWMRLSAVYALGFIECQESVDLLIEGLMDVNPEIRLKSVQGLKQLKATRGREFLAKLLNGSDPEQIRVAQDALDAIHKDPREYTYTDPESDLAKRPGYLRLKRSLEAKPESPMVVEAQPEPKKRIFNPFGIFDRRETKKDQAEIGELLKLRYEIYGEIGKKALKLFTDGAFDRPYLVHFDHEVKKINYLIQQKEGHKKEMKEESQQSTFVSFLKESVARFSMEKRVEGRLSSLQVRLNENYAELGQKVMEEYNEKDVVFLQLEGLPNKLQKLTRDIEALEARVEERLSGGRAREAAPAPAAAAAAGEPPAGGEEPDPAGKA